MAIKLLPDPFFITVSILTLLSLHTDPSDVGNYGYYLLYTLT